MRYELRKYNLRQVPLRDDHGRQLQFYELSKQSDLCSDTKPASPCGLHLHTDMDGETYHCDVCGKHYRLYYEEMA